MNLDPGRDDFSDGVDKLSDRQTDMALRALRAMRAMRGSHGAIGQRRKNPKLSG